MVAAGWEAGRVGWRAGWDGGQGRVAGRVGQPVRSGGRPWGVKGDGPGGRRGMDLRSKECSGVNIVTLNIQPPM